MVSKAQKNEKEKKEKNFNKARYRDMLILENLLEHNRITVTEVLNLAKETKPQQIYADFDYLEKKFGRFGIEKDGGILSISKRLQIFLKSDFCNRLFDHKKEKQAIAKYVVKNCIENGDSLAIDSGSMSAYVAEEILRQGKKLQGLVTNNLFIYTFSQAIAHNAILARGDLDIDKQELIGRGAVNVFTKEFDVNKCVLSFSGVTPDGDLETWAEGQAIVKVALLSLKKKKEVKKIIIALPSYKIGNVGGYRVKNIKELDSEKFMLVTDKSSNDEIIKIIEEFKRYIKKVEEVTIEYARRH